jgi:hypothetical protein
MEAYGPRFDTFITVLRDEERKLKTQKAVENGLKDFDVSDNEPLSLSQKTQRSWASKEWMIRYVARNSWAFDFIYWRYLDPVFFGDNEDGDYRARLANLSQKQQDAMEPFVKFKMSQEKERKLVQWSEEDARAELCKILA